MKDNSQLIELIGEGRVRYSTGITQLDNLFGNYIVREGKLISDPQYNNGILDGSIVSIIGGSGTGATTLALQASAEIMRSTGCENMFLFDAEMSTSVYRFKKVTSFSHYDYNDMVVHTNVCTVEMVYDYIQKIHKIKLTDQPERHKMMYLCDGKEIIKFIPTICIIDSLGMLATENIEESNYTNENVTMRRAIISKSLNDMFENIRPLCREANIIVFVINHLMNQVNGISLHTTILGANDSLPAGHSAILYSDNIIRLDVENTKKRLVKMTSIKNTTDLRELHPEDILMNSDMIFDPSL